MNIFIHYLDKELLDIYSIGKYSADIVRKVSLSIKIAILLLENEESIYIPASNYFESNLARRVLEQFRDIVDLGFIRFVSSSSTLKKFVKKKKCVYPSLYNKEQIIVEEENILDKNLPGVWDQRKSSATADIILSWKENIDSHFWEELYKISNYRNVDSFEKAMAAIPRKLDRKVFVSAHVLPELKMNSYSIDDAKEIINKAISNYYINSFLKEYNAVCFKDTFLLSQVNDILPNGYEHISYKKLCRRLAEIPMMGSHCIHILRTAIIIV